MTLTQLRHFVGLAQSGSFSRAADRLCLTQPALSRSIQALEDELGQALFDRVGRRNLLTAFGREVLQRAEQLLCAADDLHASGQAMAQGHEGVLRLGLGAGPAAMLLGPLLHFGSTERPRLRLSLSRGSTELLVQALRDSQLDALVVDARSLEPAADLCSEVISEMRGAFMCRPDHPLTRAPALQFADLLAYPMASTPLSTEVARVLVERYGPMALPARCVTLCCEDVTSLVTTCRHSDAVLLAIRAAAPDLAELVLTPALAATARFSLVTLAGRSAAPALGAVLPLIRSGLLEPGET